MACHSTPGTEPVEESVQETLPLVVLVLVLVLDNRSTGYRVLRSHGGSHVRAAKPPLAVSVPRTFGLLAGHFHHKVIVNGSLRLSRAGNAAR